MTTTARKWRSAPIVLGAFLILAGGFAKAEDAQNNYGQHPQQNAQAAQNTTYDKQYQLPPSYQGKYYPNDEPAIGYHGTSNASDNKSATGESQSGHYYYYYN